MASAGRGSIGGCEIGRLGRSRGAAAELKGQLEAERRGAAAAQAKAEEWLLELEAAAEAHAQVKAEEVVTLRPGVPGLSTPEAPAGVVTLQAEEDVTLQPGVLGMSAPEAPVGVLTLQAEEVVTLRLGVPGLSTPEAPAEVVTLQAEEVVTNNPGVPGLSTPEAPAEVVTLQTEEVATNNPGVPGLSTPEAQADPVLQDGELLGALPPVEKEANPYYDASIVSPSDGKLVMQAEPPGVPGMSTPGAAATKRLLDTTPRLVDAVGEHKALFALEYLQTLVEGAVREGTAGALAEARSRAAVFAAVVAAGTASASAPTQLAKVEELPEELLGEVPQDEKEADPYYHAAMEELPEEGEASADRDDDSDDDDSEDGDDGDDSDDSGYQADPEFEEEELLEAVPQDEKEADPYYRAAVKSAIDDDQFEAQIEDIERCSVTKELLYRIKYRDGYQEYLTADGVHWLAQALGFALAAHPGAVHSGAGGVAVHPGAVHPGAVEVASNQVGAGAADGTTGWADAAAEAAACAGAAAVAATWAGAAAKMAAWAGAATETAVLTGAAAETATWADAAAETAKCAGAGVMAAWAGVAGEMAAWELDERDLRQELAEGLEDLLDDEPDAVVREEREGIKFQMLKGTVRRIEALPRGRAFFEELQGTLEDEALVILAEVRAGGCWTAARARSVREKVAVRASEICGRDAGVQPVAAR